MNSKKPLVVVVDDNPSNIRVIGKILDENGYEPAVFLNGAKAMEFLDKETPDILLLDIMMPEMDGYEICKRIKARNDLKYLPIIFITAKTETEDIVKAFECGAADYITKPFNMAEMLARVKTHVEMRRLKSLLPICSNCKKIRDDEGYWSDVETYLRTHTDIVFSHGICPDCNKELYSAFLNQGGKSKKNT